MRRVFSRGRGSRVPDGTTVYPFLNPFDRTSALGDEPVSAPLTEFSVAAGELPPRGRSKIHVMPFVTQVTCVLAGRVTAKMKDPSSPDPYVVSAAAEEALVTTPGTFLQFFNLGDVPCRLLYIVSPPYVFDTSDAGGVSYDDAVVIDGGWDELAASNWQPPQLGRPGVRRASRQRAVERARPSEPPREPPRPRRPRRASDGSGGSTRSTRPPSSRPGTRATPSERP